MATALNVLGLSVAFATFMLIMMQINFDRSFDHCHKDAATIFRVESAGVFSNEWTVSMSRPWADAIIRSSPHVVAGTIVHPPWEMYFSVESNGGRRFYQEPTASVTPSFVDVFSLDIVEGDDRAIAEPDKVLIPQSIARKLFGDNPAVGMALTANNITYTVGGVYRDFPNNSSIRNLIYMHIDDKENIDRWNDWHYLCYVRVDAAENATDLFGDFTRSFDTKPVLGETFTWTDDGMRFRFTPLTDLHFVHNVVHDDAPKSSENLLLILLGIACVIVAMAGANYTNFSAALAPKRIRSINTQKVFGGSVSIIRSALIIEGVGISLVAFLIALAIVHCFGMTPFAALTDANVSLLQHPVLILQTAGIAALTGLLAGCYPAFYVTSFLPAMALKGNFGLSLRGKRMRSALTGIQYVSSFALIIVASFMSLQNFYVSHTALGYDKEELIVADLPPALADRCDLVAEQLRANPEVEDATFASILLSSEDSYGSWGRDYKGERISFELLPVEPSFLKIMGIELTDGRDFRESDKTSGQGAFIFNEKARAMFNLELNEKISGIEVVGFMSDIKYASMRREVSPMAFVIVGWGTPAFACVKVKSGSNLRRAISNIRSTLKEFDADYPFDVRFFDSVMQKTYKSEQRLGLLITFFSAVAILISLVGVFGLVIFDGEYRRKEIAIRKVFGSNSWQILAHFSSTYVGLLLASFVLAAPLAWYIVNMWLRNFAYKTPIHIWVYALAFMSVLGITVLTVTFQNWRAANVNPTQILNN
jgi:putative ABC transport system permease protein